MRPQAHVKTYQRLGKEGDKWAMVLYSALALTMYRNWGMKKTAVTRLIDVTWDAWKECAVNYGSSMIKMCEEITGIEIQNGDGKSWRDAAYLSGEDIGPMTDAQWDCTGNTVLDMKGVSGYTSRYKRLNKSIKATPKE